MTSRHDMFALAEELQVEQEALQDIVDAMNLITLLQLQGYRNIREVKPGCWCATYRFMYTHGVSVGLDKSGYEGRICFDTELNARRFLESWDGNTKPVVGEDGCAAIKLKIGETNGSK